MTLFRRIRHFNDDAELIGERIERRRALAGKMTASYGAIGGGAGGNSDRMGDLVAEIDSMERALAARRKRYEAERMAALQLLDALDAREAHVMECYYIDGLKNSAIADRLGYTDVHVRRLRKSAEAALSETDADALLPEWYLEEDKENDGTR